MASNAQSLLPPNATPAMRDLEAVTSRLSDVPVPLRDLWNPDKCPLDLLPWLAWALSVDKWESSWSEEQKRAVIRNSLFVHRYKGTLGAVERALSSLGYSIRVIEWWEESPKGDPFTFRIDIQLADRGIDEPLYGSIEQLINDAKNLRSHLTSMRLVARADAMVAIGAVASMGEQIYVEAMTDAQLVTPGGMVIQTGTFIEINLYSRP